MARNSCVSGSKMYRAFCCNINMKPQQFRRWGTHYLRTFWSYLWKSPRSLSLRLGRPWPATPLNNVNLYISASHSLYWTQCVIMVALCNRADHYIFALWFLSSILFFFFSSPNLLHFIKRITLKWLKALHSKLTNVQFQYTITSNNVNLLSNRLLLNALLFHFYKVLSYVILDLECLQCFDTDGWVAGRASGL